MESEEKDKTLYENLSKEDVIQLFNRRFEQYAKDHIELLEEIKRLRINYQDDSDNIRKLCQYECEVSELQTTVSDIQAQLFQERQLLLKTYSENERLKEIEGKFETLCQQVGVEECDLSVPLSYSEDVRAKFLHIFGRLQDGPNISVTVVRNEILKVLTEKEKMENRYNQLNNKYNSEIDALLCDQRLSSEERKAERARQKERNNYLVERLVSARDITVEVMQDYVKLKEHMKSKEMKYLNEKLDMEKYLGKLREQLHSMRDHPQSSSDQLVSSKSVQGQKLIISKLKQEIEALKIERNSLSSNCETYRMECQKLQAIIKKMESEVDFGRESSKKQGQALWKHLRLLQHRYQELDRRRQMDNQGFQQDIRLLRNDLKNIDKNMNKLFCIGGDNPEELGGVLDNSWRECLVTNQQRASKMRLDISRIRKRLNEIEEQIRQS